MKRNLSIEDCQTTRAVYDRGLPPHASLVTPRPQKTVPLPHNLSYLNGYP